VNKLKERNRVLAADHDVLSVSNTVHTRTKGGVSPGMTCELV